MLNKMASQKKSSFKFLARNLLKNVSIDWLKITVAEHYIKKLVTQPVCFKIDSE